MPTEVVSRSRRSSEPGPRTVVEAVARHLLAQPDALSLRFLITGDADGPRVEWSFARLDAEARRIAAALRRVAAPGDRALLLFPSGLEFGAAFLACLRAGVIAVPAPPPNPRRSAEGLARLAQIRSDCQPKVVLTVRATGLPALDGLASIVVDELDPGEELDPGDEAPTPDPSAVALLQYTSGSTGRPKGVAITQANMIANAAVIASTTVPAAHAMCWGPNFHDLGLIIGFVVPWVGGAPATLMDPMAFLQRPLRWLEAISRFRCHATAGPNFALDLVLARSADAELAGLELSCLSLLGISAEPVRARTVTAFAKRFAPWGLQPGALAPGFGMAEATLLVSAGPVRIERFDARALAAGRAVADPEGAPLVSAGPPLLSWTVAIVDRDGRALPEGELGELRIAGPSLAAGYYGRPDDPAFSPAGLLTGDLGFVWDGELFVVGRRKDVIIVRGQNHHPADIELAIAGCDRALRPGATQVFGHDDGEAERVIVVAEVEPLALIEPGSDELVRAAVRARVAEACGLEAREVVLVVPRSLPLTTSGKPQRSLTRARWLAGELPELTRARVGEALGRWLLERLAKLLERPVSALRPELPFAEQGLDSAGVVGLAAAIEGKLRRPCPPTLLYEAPTIPALVSRLLAVGAQPGEPREPAAPRSRATVQREPATPASTDAIAIVGMACRVPGADDPEALLELLRAGAITIGPAPAGREPLAASLRAAGVASEAGWLASVDEFEPERFGLAAREVPFIDPQHRLLLELGVEALERATIAPSSLAGSRTGVFVGISTHDHLERLRASGLAGVVWAGPGNAACAAANRLSYALDLRGPSMSVDTACSASLTAIHLACAALRTGECELALAGGVNLMLDASVGAALQDAGVLAPDGRCKPFSAAADGYGRAEGGGVLVLERLDAAVREGHPVLAVIRGSALGQDGRSNGITAPNGAAQAAVIRDALRVAGVPPDEIDYFEAHGTGTTLGDPVEVAALVEVVGRGPGSSPARPRPASATPETSWRSCCESPPRPACFRRGSAARPA